MRHYFLSQFDICLDDFESGSDAFFNELHLKSHCQISIFSDFDNYRRIVMVPPEYDPLLEQVNILQTQYLTQGERGKTVR